MIDLDQQYYEIELDFFRILNGEDIDTTSKHGHVLLMQRPNVPAPVKFEDLPKNLKKKFKVAGLRNNDKRLLEEARAVFEQIPAASRRTISSIKDFLRGKDASLIIAHPQDKSVADSVLWEVSEGNAARGNTALTQQERLLINSKNMLHGLKDSAKYAADASKLATVSACTVEAGFSIIEEGIEVYYGKKGALESVKTVTLNTATSGIIAASTGFVVGFTLAAVPVTSAAVAVASVPLGLYGMYGVCSRLQCVGTKLMAYNREREIDRKVDGFVLCCPRIKLITEERSIARAKDIACFGCSSLIYEMPVNVCCHLSQKASDEIHQELYSIMETMWSRSEIEIFMTTSRFDKSHFLIAAKAYVSFITN
eukprot:Partr_v1_DN28610_c4_g2_i1_m50308